MSNLRAIFSICFGSRFCILTNADLPWNQPNHHCQSHVTTLHLVSTFNPQKPSVCCQKNTKMIHNSDISVWAPCSFSIINYQHFCYEIVIQFSLLRFWISCFQLNGPEEFYLWGLKLENLIWAAPESFFVQIICPSCCEQFSQEPFYHWKPVVEEVAIPVLYVIVQVKILMQQVLKAIH